MLVRVLKSRDDFKQGDIIDIHLNSFYFWYYTKKGVLQLYKQQVQKPKTTKRKRKARK